MQRSDLQIVTSASLNYLLALPTRPKPDGAKAPVLCFLHGYDEAGHREIRQALTRHGPLRETPAATGDFIIVAPQLPVAGDIWYRYADAVRHIVTTVRETRGGDPLRTYLTGFSFGGNGVFDLPRVQPGYWAALWAVDPTRVPRKDPLRPLWLSIGEIARSQADAFIRALALKPAADTVAGLRVYLDQGQDHAGSAALAYRDERIYRWLLEKRLGSSV